ncbi:DUF2927 domain-containing protein [Vibrio sp. T187]|uniref:DUF2927 domain-containing protein n=1 Tax=Vibrio TaxID=662 RepID=UPI0010C963F6|nr:MULTISPECIES: DUF2927 domain-containing protein [Vibrio]MBW3694677.1 DUF2927 domain-containing protein [Vibrio sp. T187]
MNIARKPIFTYPLNAKLLLSLSCALFGVAPIAYATGLTWLDKAFVENAFYQVALRNEYAAGAKPLAKWSKPLKVWVEHKVGDKELHQQLTELHLQHLQDITGLSISLVQQESNANVKWIFTQESTWVEDVPKATGVSSTDHLKGAICTAGFSMNAKREIVRAGIVIPVDQARDKGKLLACIVEEITQVLGLPNDSEDAYPSIFNDQTPNDLLSPLDVVLLKLLYEPELQAGMVEEELKPIVKKILRRYEKTGVLKGAAKVSTQAPLYQLVGY